jgi:hypothetical protein
MEISLRQASTVLDEVPNVITALLRVGVIKARREAGRLLFDARDVLALKERIEQGKQRLAEQINE